VDKDGPQSIGRLVLFTRQLLVMQRANHSIVIQYAFTRETDGRTFTVMWDYQVGLVRIRPFFAAVEGHDRKVR
jgi:hypothetical protein